MSVEAEQSSIAQRIRGQASLLECVDALREWRAGVLLLAAFVAAAVVSMLGIWLASKAGAFLGFVFALLAFAVVFYGVNAAGQMLWHANQGTRLTLQQSIARSLATSHRLIGVFLLALAVYVVGALVFALLFWLTKIPVLGAALMLVLFPITVVVSGIAVVAIYAVVLPLSAPAVWSGAGAVAALTQLMVIARERIVSVLLMMVVVGFITGVVALIVFSIMMIGTMFATGLAAASSVSVAGAGGLFGGARSGANEVLQAAMGSGGLTVAAAGVGGAVVWSIALVAPALVYLRGCCAVYAANIAGMDFEAAQAAVEARLGAAREAARIKLEAAHAPPSASPPPATSAGAPRHDDDATVLDVSRTVATAVVPATAFDAAATVGPNTAVEPAAPVSRPVPTPSFPPGMPPTPVDLAIDAPPAQSLSTPGQQSPLDLTLDLGVTRSDDATLIVPRAADATKTATPAPSLSAPTPPARDADATVLLMDGPGGAAFDALPTPTSPARPEPVSVALQCPVCDAPVAAEDRFCGNCGHRLQ